MNVSREQRVAARTKEKLGLEEYERLKKNYGLINKSKANNKSDLENGMIMSLLQQNLLNCVIRAVYGCGNFRINRIRKVMKNPALLEQKRKRPVHAVDDIDIDALKAHLASFETEDGFLCAD